jgi:hypothetical protein
MNIAQLRGAIPRLIFASVVIGFCAGADAAEPAFRDLVRKYVKAQSAGTVGEKLPGLPADLQKVVALEYTILLQRGADEQAVDSSSYQFMLQDRIRVRIQPLTDLYIYIFHEGASGHRTCLLPTDKEKPPLAKRDQVLELPADGSIFEFSAPPGDEKLIVVAAEEPIDDLAALTDVVFKKPDDQLTPQEKALQDKLRARSEKTLKSIRERQAQGLKYRGLFDDEALADVSKKVGDAGTKRAVMEEPPHGKEKSTFSMAASFKGDDHAELFVTIPMKSITGKGSKP